MDKLCQQIMIALLMTIVIGVPLYFDVRMYSAFDLSKITLFYMLVFALIITWCVKRMNNSEGKCVYNPLLIPIACFVLVAVASTVCAIDPVISLLGAYKRYNGLVSLLIYLFMFFIIINYVKKDMINLFINLIIISACLMCVYGFLQHYGHDGYIWNSNYGFRIFSTIGHPAFLSAYLIMVLPLIYYKILIQSRISKVVLYLSVMIVILITFYMTKTRATFVGLALLNIFFFSFMGIFLLKRKKYHIAVILSVLIGISVIYNLKDGSVMVRMKREVNMSEGKGSRLSGTSLTRYNNALIALEIAKHYPFLGIGLDNLGIVYIHYVVELSKAKGRNLLVAQEIQDRAHSDFFDVLLTTGILGLLAYLWCIYTYVRMMWRSRNEHRMLVLALGTGVFAYFIQNQFSFGHIPILMLFWFLLGMSVVICKEKQYVA